MLTYKKTAKGMNELMARRSSIDAGLNSLLILVDGKRSEAEIRRLGLLAKIPADGLEMLVHGGYLETVGERPALPTAQEYGIDFYVAEGIVKKKPATSAKPAAKPAAQASMASVQQPDAIEFEAFQDFYTSLVGQTRNLLGIRGLGFQLRLERARNFNDLAELIAPLGEAVAKRHGLEKGMNFVRDCDVAVNVHSNSVRSSQL